MLSEKINVLIINEIYRVEGLGLCGYDIYVHAITLMLCALPSSFVSSMYEQKHSELKLASFL